jgi:flagellar motility protein MotE (MotC chaperone)/sporulation protein YlmC with PRC-barrel domain
VPAQVNENGRAAPASQPPREGNFLFLSDLLGLPVLGPAGERLGKLVDLLADVAGAYPRVNALRVRTHVGGEVKRVEWEDVERWDARGLRLKRGAESLRPLQLLSSEIPLAQDVLDRQIVDTDGAKVERVNDLHLLLARRELRVAHVDVGFRGLVRRMGWQPLVDALVRGLKPGAPYLQTDKLVSWKHVQPLSAGSPRVRLDLSRAALSEIHPADLAEILEDLDRRERAVLFRELPVEAAADALEEVEPELQRELLQALEPDKAADVLEEMQADDAADLLADLPGDESAELLADMEPSEAREVERLLTYDEDSAGGMMNPEFLRLSPELTASQALEQVRAQAEHIAHLHDAFVIGPGGRLAGVLSLRDIIVAKPESRVLGLMHDHPAPLRLDDRARKVAELAAKYNLFSLPVEDEAGKLLGVVTVDDVLEKVLHG